jgi:hypothetical protein
MTQRQAIELYAIRAREFSDAVAGLGRHQIERELSVLLREIKRLRGLCDEAAAELERQSYKADESATHP